MITVIQYLSLQLYLCCIIDFYFPQVHLYVVLLYNFLTAQQKFCSTIILMPLLFIIIGPFVVTLLDVKKM